MEFEVLFCSFSDLSHTSIIYTNQEYWAINHNIIGE